MKPLVDIVIPVHNGQDLLEKCLKALGHPNPLYREIIVDDASEKPDWTRQMASARNATFAKTRQNVGFAKTLNMGVQKGSAPLILILNSDVTLASNAIEEMAKEFDDPNVGIVGALLTFMEGTPNGPAGKVQHAGMAFDETGKPFHVHISWSPENPRVNVRKEVRCVTGACLMIRREVWNRVGGLPECYGSGTFEDVELCSKVVALKLKIIFTPKARGEHWVGHSMPKEGFPIQRNYRIFRSRCPVIWDEYKVW